MPAIIATGQQPPMKARRKSEIEGISNELDFRGRDASPTSSGEASLGH